MIPAAPPKAATMHSMPDVSHGTLQAYGQSSVMRTV
jgi:hypothetical protein